MPLESRFRVGLQATCVVETVNYAFSPPVSSCWQFLLAWVNSLTLHVAGMEIGSYFSGLFGYQAAISVRHRRVRS